MLTLQSIQSGKNRSFLASLVTLALLLQLILPIGSAIGATNLAGLSGANSSFATGWGHTLALKTDGTLLAWGYNAGGELGNGNNTNSSTPVQVKNLTNVVAVAAAWYTSLALTSDGRVYLWGSNYGGSGSTANANTPVGVINPDGTPLTDVIAIAAGAYHMLALKKDGSVVAFGENENGQAGQTLSTTNVITATKVKDTNNQEISDIVAIAAGANHSLALKSDGTVLAWGDNSSSQLGDGTTTSHFQAAPVKAGSGLLTGVTAIGSHLGNHSLALKSDGTVVAWGQNTNGQIGDGSTTTRATAVPITNLSGVTAVHTNSTSSVALKSDGTLLAWGLNSYGELGNGTTNNSLTPVAVSLTNVARVQSGANHYIAAKKDGALWGWGRNNYYQLLQTNTNNQPTPVPLEITVPLPATVVTGVSVNPASLNLTAGQAAVTLTASIAPGDAANKNVTWTSSDPAVAQVTANGLSAQVTPLKAGTATVTVTTVDGGFTASAAVNVISSTVAVTGITLNPASLNLTANATPTAVTAALAPAGATNQNVTWTTSDATVASVVPNGLSAQITPLKAGTATITAKAADGGFTATTTVTVTDATTAVTGIEPFNPSSLTLKEGSKPYPLTAKIQPADATNQNILWTSSNNKVATVSPDGLVSPLSVGTAVITATTEDGGFTAKLNLTVVSKNTAIPHHLDASRLKIEAAIGDEIPFQVFAVYDDNRQQEITNDPETTYRTDNEAAATVTPGLVHIVGPGKAEITVTYRGVVLVIPVNRGSTTRQLKYLTPSDRYLGVPVGEKANLELTAVYSDGSTRNVTNLAAWMTENAEVATVNSGEVVGISPGGVNITAQFGGQHVTIKAEVYDAGDGLLGISANAKNLRFYRLGDEKQLQILAHYEDGSVETLGDEVFWQTLNSGVVEVDDEGILTAAGSGKTTIIAYYHGRSAQIDVEVKERKVKKLTASKTKLTLNTGASSTLILTSVFDDNTRADVTADAQWSVRNSAVASVEGGTVTGITRGSTTVTAKFLGKSLAIPVTIR